jgi:hypothetical protein
MFMKRISWLDSCRMPAHIHLTNDEGDSTICGHNPKNGKWLITDSVPRRLQGRSRYCRVCFKHGGKSLPWYIRDQKAGS